jgi:hypothetical protein
MKKLKRMHNKERIVGLEIGEGSRDGSRGERVGEVAGKTPRLKTEIG